MATFGGVSFLTFLDLRIILDFWILKGSFWVCFLTFWNFENGFGIRMATFGGVSFLYFFNLRPIYRFLVLKGVFFYFLGGPNQKTFLLQNVALDPRIPKIYNTLGLWWIVLEIWLLTHTHTRTHNVKYCHHWPCGPAVRKNILGISLAQWELGCNDFEKNR